MRFSSLITSILIAALLTNSLLGPIALLVVGAFLKILFAIGKPEFRLYYAMGCFRIIQRKENEVEKMKYMIRGLNSYNKYLKRCSNLQINDLSKIYSKISSTTQRERESLTESIPNPLKEEIRTH